MPPSGFTNRGIAGVLIFTQENYKECLRLWRSGKFPTIEAAMEFEIANIERVLAKLHITPEGDIVERPDGR